MLETEHLRRITASNDQASNVVSWCRRGEMTPKRELTRHDGTTEAYCAAGRSPLKQRPSGKRQFSGGANVFRPKIGRRSGMPREPRE